MDVTGFPIEREALHKMIVAMKWHRRMFDMMREQTGLGRSAHRTLMILADHDGGISQTALAERLEISTAAVAVLLKKMETEGFILRTAKTNDSRTNSIELTERGQAIVVQSRMEFAAIDEKIFEGFSETEMRSLIGYLDRIQTNMKKATTKGGDLE